MGKGFVFGLLLTTTLLAGPIEDEYNRTRDEIEKLRDNAQLRKEQLEKTLSRSLQRALLRYFNDPDYQKAELKEGNYERSEIDPYTYYYKYKDYVGYFTYSVDPEKYLAVPIAEKILQKPTAKAASSRGD
ncbi:MAG: hypothetical protein NZM25_02065 [Leptospiraceae bacterium]|nr:hypothetical protein [Leptospiraceae bacterium]MDW8306962.1 hypothetical protein [Leptospiraceae bacterium]